MRILYTHGCTSRVSLIEKIHFFFLFDLIVFPLCYIINKSLLTGIFPEKLKIVKEVPLYNGGSTQDLNNFRPISLLSIFDKIIEKIMHKRLYHFLELHNVYYLKSNLGFRQNNSTSYALIGIAENIKESIDNGNFGHGIYILTLEKHLIQLIIAYF